MHLGSSVERIQGKRRVVDNDGADRLSTSWPTHRSFQLLSLQHVNQALVRLRPVRAQLAAYSA